MRRAVLSSRSRRRARRRAPLAGVSEPAVRRAVLSPRSRRRARRRAPIAGVSEPAVRRAVLSPRSRRRARRRAPVAGVSEPAVIRVPGAGRDGAAPSPGCLSPSCVRSFVRARAARPPRRRRGAHDLGVAPALRRDDRGGRHLRTHRRARRRHQLRGARRHRGPSHQRRDRGRSNRGTSQQDFATDPDDYGNKANRFDRRTYKRACDALESSDYSAVVRKAKWEKAEGGGRGG